MEYSEWLRECAKYTTFIHRLIAAEIELAMLRAHYSFGLSKDVSRRFKRLQAFVDTATEQELELARDEINRLVKRGE